MFYSVTQIIEYLCGSIVGVVHFLLGKGLAELGVKRAEPKGQKLSFWSDQSVGGGSKNHKQIDYNSYSGRGEYQDKDVQETSENLREQALSPPPETKKSYPLLARGNTAASRKQGYKTSSNVASRSSNEKSTGNSNSGSTLNPIGLALPLRR